MTSKREYFAAIVLGVMIPLTLVLALAVAKRNEGEVMDRPLWLLFTKSSGYEHAVIKQDAGAPSYLFKQIEPVFAQRGLKLVESKDGRVFEPSGAGGLAQFAGFVFYTSGDLTTEGTDRQPPMSAAGKANLLAAVAAGTPFIGLHSVADTFHPTKDGQSSDFLNMLGGEFEAHGEEQVATVHTVDTAFHGAGQEGDWSIHEEWYALKNVAKDIHPIHVLNPAGMKGEMYARPEYPITWTRLHGKGRVFYTALAHREDTIASRPHQKLIGGAIDWCRQHQ